MLKSKQIPVVTGELPDLQDKLHLRFVGFTDKPYDPETEIDADSFSEVTMKELLF